MKILRLPLERGNIPLHKKVTYWKHIGDCNSDACYLFLFLELGHETSWYDTHEFGA